MAILPRAHSSDILLATTGVIYFISDACVSSQLEVAISGEGSTDGGLGRIRQLAHAGNIFFWTVLIDGVYKIRFHAEADPAIHTRFGAGNVDITEQRLELPTGRVQLRSAVGRVVDVADLAPGSYRVTLAWSSDEESKHFDLASASEYPDADGPDGVIILNRIAEA